MCAGGDIRRGRIAEQTSWNIWSCATNISPSVCESKPPAGRKTCLQVCTFVGEADRSAFALLLTKVTKHIPPQTSPVGLSLAGIWSAVSRFFM